MSVPGESSHFHMAPELRMRELHQLKIEEQNPKKAAVLMLFYPKNEITHLVLILRPTYEGVHSGQVALPGGRVEDTDPDFEHTALRETWEEVGVPMEAMRVIKPMTKVYIPPSNFWVYPYIGSTMKTPQFIPQEDEVAQVIEIPIAKLLDDANVTSQKLSTSYAQNIKVPVFNLDGYVVWGATAMMLSELKVFLKGVLE
ncbi:8-oxo-dGTP pyrophosphatase MutT (NUDIX family) [Aquimarina brevivitae]|uniref:8-oxo-dGTP pyrophosphatase MutT (NUDIX family) n=2 Tax=Aquimarina brevivitae TaxID=323412 RepID=A0A4Q7P3S3_9FLAO|nr:8-oxo-dGTP pyrophosphatase MutT (NUDIX family) [Aquimarina brevivitae]